MFFLQAKYQHIEEVTKDMSLFLKKLNWITQSNYSHLNYFLSHLKCAFLLMTIAQIVTQKVSKLSCYNI